MDTKNYYSGGIGNEIGLKTGVTLCSSEEAMGVNSMSELAKAEKTFQEKYLQMLMMDVVTRPWIDLFQLYGARQYVPTHLYDLSRNG